MYLRLRALRRRRQCAWKEHAFERFILLSVENLQQSNVVVVRNWRILIGVVPNSNLLEQDLAQRLLRCSSVESRRAPRETSNRLRRPIA